MARELGIVGLGRMGGGLALQARDKGMRVVGFDGRGISPELTAAGVEDALDLAGLAQALRPPRLVLLYVPAGPAVDAILEALRGRLARGDLVADGGNSYWGDSIDRQARLTADGIGFVDLGTSGGLAGARNGACFMAGGERAVVERLEPLLRELAVPGGYVHAGGPGAGHYAKLVHNGVEFGMLQAIGEGMDLLERAPPKLDVAGVLACWRHGSVIRGWLVDLMHGAYVAEGGMERVPTLVEDTGEVNWLVADALRLEIPIPVIAQAVMQLFASRDDRKGWARAIAMMRRGFGGHPYGPSPALREERCTSRVSWAWRRGR